MRVLVTCGSKRGGTVGIADTIAAALRDQGLDAEVVAPAEVQSLAGYDAVVVGGSLYAGRWHRDARRFLKHHAPALRTRPVWVFFSGPLDASASTHELAPPASVRSLLDDVEIAGHATFGGRLEPEAKGFVASRMARHHAGDWRDEQRIRAWADAIAAQLLVASS